MLATIVLLCLLAACHAEESDDVLLARAHNQFGINLLKELAREEDPPKNVFFSPTSIAITFGMAYAGARGSSEAELGSALGHSAVGLTDRSSVLTAYKKLLDLTRAPNVPLDLANLVLIRDDVQVLEAYKEELQEVFGAELRSVDFGPAVASEVNAWVREKTRSKITNLLTQGQRLDSLLLLLNAAYFKGVWVTKFNRNHTKPERFFNFGASEVTRPAMHVHNQFRYYRIDNQGASALEIPYHGEELAMVVVLPDDKAGVPRLRNQLNLDLLRNISEYAVFTDVKLQLPKFSLQARYNLVSAARALGLSDVFGESGDFKGISETAAVHLSGVLHKAAAEVNEEGTMAAAVTGASFGSISTNYQPSPPPLAFTVDHPFLFYVRHVKTGRLLFLGEVNEL